MRGDRHRLSSALGRRALLLSVGLVAVGFAVVSLDAVSLAAVGATAVGAPSVGAPAVGAPLPATGAAASSSLLKLGSRGPQVRRLQRTLAGLTYLPAGAVDGVFGMRTWHAVVAFQGWSGIGRDGVVGPQTRRALLRARIPRPWSTAPGFEIHIQQQVLLLVRGGRVVRAIHVSTGRPGWPTPSGHFTIIARDAMSWSVAFQVWMPLAQYFSGGYALHEFADVPAYPASHGCVRVPTEEAQVVWRFGRLGMRLWTAP